jgi:hypothetical protein
MPFHGRIGHPLLGDTSIASASGATSSANYPRAVADFKAMPTFSDIRFRPTRHECVMKDSPTILLQGFPTTHWFNLSSAGDNNLRGKTALGEAKGCDPVLECVPWCLSRTWQLCKQPPKRSGDSASGWRICLAIAAAWRAPQCARVVMVGCCWPVFSNHHRRSKGVL